MLGLGRFLSSLRDMYKEVNPATLTGAVDVIVVEQQDGTFVCSPFYVRFGKMGVLTSREKVVDITINDEPINLHMRLSHLGDAYFIEDAADQTDSAFPKSDWSTYNWPNESWRSRNLTNSDRGYESSKASVDMKPSVSENQVKPQYYFGDLSLSLCDGLDLPNLTDEQFATKQVTFEQLNANPEIVFSPDLVIKWSGKYYKHNVAVPILLSMIFYQRPLTDYSINRLLEKYHSVALSSVEPAALQINVDSLQSSSTENICSSSSNAVVPATTVATATSALNLTPSLPGAPISPSTGRMASKKGDSYGVVSWFSWRRGSSTEPDGKNDFTGGDKGSCSPPQYGSDENLNSPPLSEELNDYERECPSPTDFVDRGALSDSEIDRSHKRTIRYKRSLILTSDQLKKLNLQCGTANHATFSVTTKYQGTCICECDIYLWRWSDKIVVSDIDGTITKSDVLGHLLPIVGWQWEHLNVVELYGRIMDNGYKFIYLTARAIGQSHQTKDYLRSIKQNNKSLPEGPLLLSPTSLFMALHREVIEKKPEIFKTKCLRDVRTLFPDSLNPFYAGFGNKATDEVAYRAAGISSHKIFTINTSGEVRFTEKDLKSSYEHILDLVDHIFPPLSDTVEPVQSLICIARPAKFTAGSLTAPTTGMSSATSEPMFSNSSSTKVLDFACLEEYSCYNYWRQTSDTIELDLNQFAPPDKNAKKSSKKSQPTIAVGKK